MTSCLQAVLQRRKYYSPRAQSEKQPDSQWHHLMDKIDYNRVYIVYYDSLSPLSQLVMITSFFGFLRDLNQAVNLPIHTRLLMSYMIERLTLSRVQTAHIYCKQSLTRIKDTYMMYVMHKCKQTQFECFIKFYHAQQMGILLTS